MAQQLGSGDAADGYTINGDVAVSGTVTAKAVANSGNQTVTGNLAVTGTTTLTGTAELDGVAKLDSDLQHNGTKVGFYGTTATAQRTSSSVQRTSNLSTLTTLASFGSVDALAVNQIVASLAEVMNTLQAYGLWSIS